MDDREKRRENREQLQVAHVSYLYWASIPPPIRLDIEMSEHGLWHEVEDNIPTMELVALEQWIQDPGCEGDPWSRVVGTRGEG